MLSIDPIVTCKISVASMGTDACHLGAMIDRSASESHVRPPRSRARHRIGFWVDHLRVPIVMLAYSAVPTPLYPDLPGARRLLLVHDHGDLRRLSGRGRGQPASPSAICRTGTAVGARRCPRSGGCDAQRRRLPASGVTCPVCSSARVHQRAGRRRRDRERDRMARRNCTRRPGRTLGQALRRGGLHRREPRRDRPRAAGPGDARRLGRRRR